MRVEIATAIRYNVVKEFKVGTTAPSCSTVATDHPNETVWRMRIAMKSRRRINLTRQIYARENDMKNTRLWSTEE